MRLHRRITRRRLGDEGTTLAELLVTMAVLSVVMIMFTAATMQVYRTVTATESLSDAQNELGRAFQRFDRELRYASGITNPATLGSGTYVEFAGADPTRCYQLRLVPGPAGTDAQGVLQLRTWVKGSPPGPVTRGQTLASQIVTTGAAPYFERQLYNAKPYASPTVTPTGGPVGTRFQTLFQRLRIRLTTRSGAGTAQIDTTFTALNTTNETPETNACIEGRPTS